MIAQLVLNQTGPARAPATIEARSILGVRVDDVTYGETVALCEAYMRSGRPHHVVTSNPEFVMMARRDPEFRPILNAAALSLPDGGGLLAAARLFGLPFRAQVRGTDLVELLAARAAVEGYRFFLLGAAEGVAAEAAANLQARHPGLQVAGTFAGDPSPASELTIAERMRLAGRVDLLLVAYGAPVQDQWIARNQARLGIPLAMGVGGVFDFFSGRVKRAPRWVREAGFEWLYRLMRQPWRWRRQLALPQFALAVLASAALGRQAVTRLPPRPTWTSGQ